MARILDGAIRSRLAGGDTKLADDMSYRCYVYELFSEILMESVAVILLMLAIPFALAVPKTTCGLSLFPA